MRAEGPVTEMLLCKLNDIEWSHALPVSLCLLLDKESGEQLSKMVDDACMLLADYNGRLAAEIDDRKQLTRMLSDFLRCQKEFLAEKEHKLEVRIVLF